MNTTHQHLVTEIVANLPGSALGIVATYGYKGVLPESLTEDEEFAVRNAIQDRCKELAVD